MYSLQFLPLFVLVSSMTIVKDGGQKHAFYVIVMNKLVQIHVLPEGRKKKYIMNDREYQ